MAKKEFFTAEWFPYKHERFERSDKVALMSLTEEGAYHRAIRLAWRERSLTADPDVLAARIGKKCTAAVAQKVLRTFVADPDAEGRVIHPVVEEVRSEQEWKFLNKSRGGKKAAKTRLANAVNKEDASSTEQNAAEPSRTSTRIENRELRRENESSKEDSEDHTHNAGGREGPLWEDAAGSEDRSAEPLEWSWQMRPLIDAFPEYLPDRVTPAFIGHIDSAVKLGDEVAWAATIETYMQNFDPAINRYLPDKAGNLLGVFAKKKAEIERQKQQENERSNGSNKTAGTGQRRGGQRDGDGGGSTEEYLQRIGARPKRQ